ncbi:hypothetical protein BX616_006683, partial [Lobosporangium transversale]
AACVTPTDPVLSNSVVKGRFAEKYVPPRIRHLLSAESGMNDGMALPFLYLGLFLLREQNVGMALGKWVYMIWLYQILLSVTLGGLIGAGARKLVKGAKNRNLIDKDDWFSNEIAEAHIQEIIDMLLNLACFIYIGASVPFSQFHDLMLELSVWRLIVLAMLFLSLRRMPFVVAMKRFVPALTTYREAAFAGWFGPIGVGAMYLSKVTAQVTNPEKLGENAFNLDRLLRVRSVIFPIVMFLIFSSVLIHGVTVPLLHLQYKYTRTWSKKREESTHAVSRLPHVNIGDDILIPRGAPAALSNGSLIMAGEDLKQQQQHQYYQQQRLMNHPYGGYCRGEGVVGFGGNMMSPPLGLSRTNTNHTNQTRSTNYTNQTRTLECMVQGMKESAKKKWLLGPNSSNNSASSLSLGKGKGERDTTESLRKSRHASQELNIQSDSNSEASSSSSSSSSSNGSSMTIQIPSAIYQEQQLQRQQQQRDQSHCESGSLSNHYQLSASNIYEVKCEKEDHGLGITWTVNHEVEGQGQVRVVEALEDEEKEKQERR